MSVCSSHILSSQVTPWRASARRLAGARCAQQPGAGEEDDVVVRRGVGELQVVAGVGPPAFHVDRPADAGEVLVGDQVLAADHVRPGVDVGLRVEEVRRLTVERPGHLVVAVALVLVEGDPEADHRAEQPACTGDLEPRRRGPHRAGGPHAVRAALAEGAEVEPVDGGVRAAPGARGPARHAAGQRDPAVLVDDPERRARQRTARHQRGLLGLVREPALLVHAHDRRRLLACCGELGVGRQHRHQREQRSRRDERPAPGRSCHVHPS